MTTVEDGAHTGVESNGSGGPLAALQRQVAELRRDLDRLRDTHYEHAAGLNEVIDTERVIVRGGDLGIMEIGKLDGDTFGIRIRGRGNLHGQAARLSVSGEDGAELSVDGPGVYVYAVAPADRQTPPEIQVNIDGPGGDRAVRLTGRFMGYDDGGGGDIDVAGGWCGMVELSDGSTGNRAYIDSDLLDETAVRHGTKQWPRNDVRGELVLDDTSAPAR